MQTGKVLSLIVGGILAFFALVLLSVWLLVDPNHYKTRIASAVKDATGRELLLQGDIKLSVFPWIALELGPASLSNLPGFGTQPFVSFQHAAFRVKLLPLLGKRLEIGKIEVDGLDARLIKNADGKANWAGFGHAGTGASPAAAEDGTTAARAFTGISGVKITHSRVSYNQMTLEHIDAETGTIGEKGLVPVTIHFDASRGVAAEHATVDAQLDFSGDFGARRFHVAAISFHGWANLAANPRPIRWNFSAPAVDVDLQAQILSVPLLALDVAGAHLGGNIKGIQIVDAPVLSGTTVLEPLVVREYLPRVGMIEPRTRDPRAFSLVAASSRFAYATHALMLDDLQLTLDETHVKGRAMVTALPTPNVTFSLTADQIDVDRYLAPPGGPAQAQVAVAPATNATVGKPPTFDVNGTLTMASIRAASLDLTDISVTFSMIGGVLRLHPLQAQVDGGQYAGDISFDDREIPAVLSMDEHLTGVDVGRLTGAGSKKIHLSGRGNLTLKATGRGTEAQALLHSLDGHVDAYVTHGAVEGVDIGYQLGRAEAVIRRQDAPNVPDTRRTPFDALKMSADIAGGVAQSKDLTFASPVLKVTGQGSANLATQGIDFALLADTLKSAGDVPIQIPIKVTGTTANPTVRPDLDALAKGQLGRKLKDMLQEKLKGFFNR